MYLVNMYQYALALKCGAYIPGISTDKDMHGLFCCVLLTNSTVPSIRADYACASVVVYLVFTCCAIATWIWYTVINV